MTGKRIVSIHAHPDDAEILAGGTLALLAQLGHSVTIVTMTPGDCGSNEYAADEIAAIRRAEAAASAGLIGAEYMCAEFRDIAIFNHEQGRRRVAELLRKVRPDIVLTAAVSDYLCDHEMTSLLVRDACFAAPAPNYATGGNAPALDQIPHLYYMDPVGGHDRQGHYVMPDFAVDVAQVFDLKRKMLSSHASQRNWLLRQHGMENYIEQMEIWTRDCGMRFGLQAAEGFRHYRGHPYPATPLLQELLGATLIHRG